MDADACPVKNEILRVAEDVGAEVLFVASYAAYVKGEQSLPDRVQTVYVDQGFQAADMYIANTARSGDVVVTNDYGLAALCLPRGAKVLSPRGTQYSAENMDELLTQRHLAGKARRSGQRTKGPKAMSLDDRLHFQHKLTKLLRSEQENVAT
ncbi:YaiI/YqxD family protein [Paenibacillus marinisediminis]